MLPCGYMLSSHQSYTFCFRDLELCFLCYCVSHGFIDCEGSHSDKLHYLAVLVEVKVWVMLWYRMRHWGWSDVGKPAL